MSEEKRLILRALNLLDLIDPDQNQPVPNLLRGILRELLENV